MKVFTYIALIACTQAVNLRKVSDPILSTSDKEIIATVGKEEFMAIKK